MSPTPGHHFNVKGLIAQNNQWTESAPTIQFGKKPFDWMTDSQWQMLLVSSWNGFRLSMKSVLPFLQMLASQFSWVHPILEKQGKDGKDALWRTIGEGIAPETIPLLDSLGCK